MIATDSILEELIARRCLLDAAEVAAIFQEHVKTTRRRARNGELPHVRMRGRIRFDPKELASWIREHHLEATR